MTRLSYMHEIAVLKERIETLETQRAALLQVLQLFARLLRGNPKRA